MSRFEIFMKYLKKYFPKYHKVLKTLCLKNSKAVGVFGELSIEDAINSAEDPEGAACRPVWWDDHKLSYTNLTTKLYNKSWADLEKDVS